MKYLKIRDDFTPPSGNEWNAATYPGPGAYLLPSGNLHLVNGGMVMCCMPVNVPPLEHGMDCGSGVDVHRLFDQLIELKK